MTSGNVGAYAIGIDLGTTHCALSYFNLRENKPRGRAQPILPVAQLTGPSTVEEKLLLPSFLYLPNPHEFPPNALALPWDKDPREIVGEFARAHGSKVPTRLVASAKSWLSYAAVDRTAAILPWGAADEVPHLSPLVIGTHHLFLGLEDPRFNRVAAMIHMESRAAVDIAVAHFTTLWEDRRALVLCSRVEAQYEAIDEIRRLRWKR